MKPGRTLLNAGDGLLDRILCVLGAVLFSQVPEFMQQYLQRLGGHLDEARRQLQQFQEVATSSGISLKDLIHRTATNAEPAVAKLGAVMSDTVDRVDALAAAQAALLHASLWSRPFVFVRHLDFAIAHATWSIFKPAVPTTLEGMVYALLGVIVFLGIYHFGIKYPFSVFRTRLAAARADISVPPPPPPRVPAPDDQSPFSR